MRGRSGEPARTATPGGAARTILVPRRASKPRSVRSVHEHAFVQQLDELAAEITSLAAHIGAAMARWLALVAEFDEREGWGPGGFRSCAHWVSWCCSVSPVTAREYVRVAHRLRELPVVAAAFARGELSYSQARALTRVEGIADEARLVELAGHASAAELERIVRGYRLVRSIEDGVERQYAERSLTWSYDDEGALVVRGRLPAEQGALLVAALEAARDLLGSQPPEAEAADAASAEAPWTRDPVAARNADALLALAQASLGGAATSSADTHQVVVHVDAAALAAGPDAEAAEGLAGRCEVEAGVPLPREAVRRLACDVSLVRIVERDGRPLTVGRKTRAISPALRRAMRVRDGGGCVFPGCGQIQHVDAHHIEHWADGGRTDLHNLVQLCRYHHRLVHEGGYGMCHGPRGLVFTAPDGHTLPTAPRRRRGDCDELRRDNSRRGVRASAEALTPDSFGDRLDLGAAADVILGATSRQRE